MFRPMPRPTPMQMPTSTAGKPQLDSATLASLLGSVQVPEQPRTPLGQTTFPEMPRTLNPEILAMLLAAMQGSAPAQQPSLGQLIG